MTHSKGTDPRAALRVAVAIVTVCASLLAAGGHVAAQQRVAPASRSEVQLSFAPVVKKAAPAVVNVFVNRRVREFVSPFANDPFFREFFGRRFGAPSERMQNSLGSGVIVSADGIVVTNNHVIQGSGTAEIRIVLADRREFEARVLAQDPKTDLAILKIVTPKPTTFAFLQFDDSDSLEVGDIVLAIGNPFGVGQTVTQGIVSALSRSEIGRSEEQVFIQTDAAINPGNSGGALVDMSGQLVGINTAIFSRSGGSHGIGFAIPSNLVRLVVESAARGKPLERPWVGARLIPVTRDIASAVGLDRTAGALVERVYRNGPAAAAGLQPGDVITGVDGKPVADARALMYRLTTLGVNTRAPLDVYRAGRKFVIELPLRKAPGPGVGDAKLLTGRHPFGGAKVAELSPAVADELGLDEDTEGVIVVEVRPSTAAAQLGLRPADIIVSVDGVAIRKVAELEGLLAGSRGGWRFEISRNGTTYQLQVPG